MKTLFTTVIFFSLFLSGCGVITNNSIALKSNTTNFANLSSRLVHGICTKKDMGHDEDKDFYIVDFVNIDNLENNSKLGFILSSQIKSDMLSTCSNVRIKELELGKNIRLGRSGSKILTRELDEVKSRVVDENSNIIIGTYAITIDKLILFTKVVDLTTGEIKASSTVSTPITQEILDLEGYTQKSHTKQQSSNIYRPLVL
ncbi:FlgO family outer membrane protein [Arcobacter sp. FWKO B]|uniref:FlgO family outer membrane protein n=1 Tax=Arcobacter sp. FWKO B TaxID=2593672 RepID=UPI0018A3FECD|nr:FlgO family outer membrane protein [Arcobacter sp. FWKO B]QOG12483.1 hypothetical protein FWKOB_07105 [Arcobacter sp. FWKO B]